MTTIGTPDFSDLDKRMHDSEEAQRAAQLLSAARFPDADRDRWHYAPVAEISRITDSWLAEDSRKPSQTRVAEILSRLGIEADSALVFMNGQIVDTDGASSRTGLTIDESPIDQSLLEDISAQPLNLLTMATAPSPTTISIDETFDADRALVIVHLFDAAAGVMSQTRLQIRVAENARVRVEEHFASAPESANGLANLFCLLHLGPGSDVEHLRWCHSSEQVLWIRDWRLRVSARAKFNSVVLDFGAALGRNETHVMLAGADAFARTAGVGVVGHGHKVEHIAVMDHAAPGARSEQDYASIAATRASVVFNGKVRVAEGADGTDSSQSNRNLLLDDTATINTKPELEIYADEVKCAHGATTGQLDEQALFYLVSRGIPQSEARDLLVKAFADPVLAHISDAVQRSRASEHIQAVLTPLIKERS